MRFVRRYFPHIDSFVGEKWSGGEKKGEEEEKGEREWISDPNDRAIERTNDASAA